MRHIQIHFYVKDISATFLNTDKLINLLVSTNSMQHYSFNLAKTEPQPAVWNHRQT